MAGGEEALGRDAEPLGYDNSSEEAHALEPFDSRAWLRNSMLLNNGIKAHLP